MLLVLLAIADKGGANCTVYTGTSMLRPLLLAVNVAAARTGAPPRSDVQDFGIPGVFGLRSRKHAAQ